MTPVQAKTLAFVGSFVVDHGYSPSYEEIGEALGVASKSGVHRIVAALVEMGKLRKVGRRMRCLELPEGTSPSARIAQKLVGALVAAHGFNDGDGMVIACTPEECLAALQAALA